MEPGSPALQADSLPAEPPGEPENYEARMFLFFFFFNFILFLNFTILY